MSLTDVSVEEAGEYVRAMRAAGLDTVFLAAPTSSPRRQQLVAEYSSGFVYLVSRTGVTGERDSLSEADRPIGPSRCAPSPGCRWRWDSASRVRNMWRSSGVRLEAVVVGSAIVHLIERNLDNPSLEIQLEAFAREMKHGFEMAAAGVREP